jgi:uncharacterized membrane protein
MTAVNDDRFWRGGMFYYNPDNPALLHNYIRPLQYYPKLFS